MELGKVNITYKNAYYLNDYSATVVHTVDITCDYYENGSAVSSKTP